MRWILWGEAMWQRSRDRHLESAAQALDLLLHCSLFLGKEGLSSLHRGAATGHSETYECAFMKNKVVALTGMPLNAIWASGRGWEADKVGVTRSWRGGGRAADLGLHNIAVL